MRMIRTLFLSLCALLAITGLAWAVQPVVDQAAIGKLIDQLTKMQEQTQILGDVRQGIQDQIDAIGKVGQISLPIINSAKIASQIGQDMQCLKPDFEKLMPNVSFEELNWDSVCQGTNAYEQTLLIDPDKRNEMLSWKEREDYYNEIKTRRENVLKDAALKGMALADRANEAAEDQNKAADQIEQKADSAQKAREELDVIARALAQIMRGQAQQQQVEAQQLKVMSAIALHMGVPAEQVTELKEDD